MHNFPILFINPPVLTAKGIGTDIFQPLGLACLAALARERGYPVSILDAAALGYEQVRSFDAKRDVTGLDYQEIKKRIKEYSPKVVCITITFTVQRDSAFKVASMVKQVDPDVVVIVGGPHVTVRPEECAAFCDVDFAVVGEGEYTLTELLEKLAANAGLDDLRQVQGIAFKDGNSVHITPRRPLIQDLDALPFPARDLLPMDIYFEAAKSCRASRDLDKPWASVFTSRGCPFNCVFCSINLTMGRGWRARSAQNVIEELEHLVSTYGIKQIDFEDDNVSCNPKRLEKICDLIIQKGLDIEWFTPNGIRADTLNEDLLRKMKASGCRELWFAPESGSQRVVDEVIDKRIDLDYVAKMITVCKKVGIGSNCFFVIGLPGETKQELEQTVKFAQKMQRLGADNCLFSLATPLYGTRLYQLALERDLLIDFNDRALMYGRPLIKNPEYSVDHLLAVQKKAQSDNRRLYILSQFNKLVYYLRYNPRLVSGPLKNMWRIGSIFTTRRLHMLQQKLQYLLESNKFKNFVFSVKRGLFTFASYWTNFQIVPKPSVMYLELTYRCTCQCQFCDRWKVGPEKISQELSTGQVKNLLQQASDLGVRYVGFTGGEPFLRLDIFELGRYARGLGMDVTVASNGTLINEENVDQIVSTFSSVTVSMDGIKRETHDEIRGVAGVYDKAGQAIKLMKERGFPVAVNMVITKKNYHEIDEYIKFFNSNSIPLQLTPVHDCAVNHLKMSPELKGMDFPDFEQVWKQLSTKYKFLQSNYYRQVPAFFTKPDKLRQQFICFAGSVLFFVSPYGDIFPCEFIRQKMGNIKDESLAEIWEKGKELRCSISSPDRPCVCWSHCVVPLNRRLTRFVALKRILGR